MRLPQFCEIDRRGFPMIVPNGPRQESPACARARKAYFAWLAKNPAAYQRFVNRAGLPVESK